MQYLCLRDCYTGDRFYYGGETYELSDDIVKSEKNFKLVGQPEPPPEPLETITEAIEGEFVCPDCGRPCSSAFGLRSHRRVHKKK